MKEKKYIQKLEKNLDKIKEQLLPGESFCHCLDKESFSMRFYNPVWIVTSEARIYSLKCMKWLDPYQDKNGSGRKKSSGERIQKPYYLRNSNTEAMAKNQVKSAIRVQIHQLVANYFCDKAIVEIYGEDKCEVHHKKSYNYEKPCSENNRASNLQYIIKKDHNELTKISMGNVEGDLLTCMLARTGSEKKKKGMAKFEYDYVEKKKTLKMQVMFR